MFSGFQVYKEQIDVSMRTEMYVQYRFMLNFTHGGECKLNVCPGFHRPPSCLYYTALTEMFIFHMQ